MSREPLPPTDFVRCYRPARDRTWAAEERDLRDRPCMCCGKRGHYQRALEAYIAEHGMDGFGVYVRDGRVRDGHHRVVAALRLGFAIPLESKAEADARWVRDHGFVGWEERTFGDLLAFEEHRSIPRPLGVA